MNWDAATQLYLALAAWDDASFPQNHSLASVSERQNHESIRQLLRAGKITRTVAEKNVRELTLLNR